jgi:hypothetical protein
MGTISDLLKQLEKFPPLVTDQGLLSVADWLVRQGVDAEMFGRPNPI